MARGQDVPVIEYHNGKPMHYYDGIRECAANFHCHVELIKGLIFTGQAFPYLEEKITFDIHPSSHYHIERNRDAEGNRYYCFNVVKDNSNNNNCYNEGNLEKRGESKRGEK